MPKNAMQNRELEESDPVMNLVKAGFDQASATRIVILEEALQDFVSCVDVTGGILKGEGPVAASLWYDLADSYVRACSALGRQPVIQEGELNGYGPH